MGVWIARLFRSLFLLIDRVIYWAANMVYQLFIMISETGVFTPEDIRTFAGRIYVLLGVFMLFKVSFSLITYILNPDDLTDKNKGVSKLLTNFFVVLIGIIAVPYIFQAAFSLQAIVLKGNVIGSLIMGMDAEVMGKNNYNYVEQGGNLMSYTTLSAFIRLNENVVGDKCSESPVVGAVDNNGVPLYNDDGSRQATLNSECTSSALEAEVNNGKKVKDVLISSYTANNMYVYTDTDLVNLRAENKDGNEDWIFNYNFIISSAAGVFLAWILLLFCIDVATRSVKLGFLQLIAPIPIISYIDPKSGKDGIFKKWTKQCISTYADLFIRLVAIYFAVFVISSLVNGRIYNIVTNETQTNIFVIIFIIFGALMFAKQLPQLISDLTGVKLDGGFTLNPMNKLQQVPLVGSGLTHLAGRTAGAAESMIHDQTGHRGRAALAGWFGAGDALHGKVPLMGAKPGAQTVRSVHTGREAGYEVATGSKMKRHMPFSSYYAGKGKEEIADLKKNVRAPLQQELSRIGLQKQETSNVYKNLNEQLQNATSDTEKSQIRTKMEQAQDRYQKLSAAEGKVTGDISTVNDQIKDLERSYDIDKSTVEKLNEIRGKISDGEVSSYTPDLPPISDVPTQPSSSTTSRGTTVGGVNVSRPNANGERTTAGGIVLPSGTDTDDRR